MRWATRRSLSLSSATADLYIYTPVLVTCSRVRRRIGPHLLSADRDLQHGQEDNRSQRIGDREKSPRAARVLGYSIWDQFFLPSDSARSRSHLDVSQVHVVVEILEAPAALRVTYPSHSGKLTAAVGAAARARRDIFPYFPQGPTASKHGEEMERRGGKSKIATDEPCEMAPPDRNLGSATGPPQNAWTTDTTVVIFFKSHLRGSPIATMAPNRLGHGLRRARGRIPSLSRICSPGQGGRGE